MDLEPVNAKSVAIHIDRSDPAPLYLQLADQLTAQIEGGSLDPGGRLPSVRSLSRRLGVNNATVVAAYRDLSQRGLVVQRVGSGTYARRPSAGPRGDRYTWEVDAPAGSIDLATAAAPPGLFPLEEFRAVLDEVMSRDGADAFHYGEVQGYRPLRQSLAHHARERGVEAGESDIHIVSGAQQGLDLLSKVLLAPGDAALVESPGYPGAAACFEARGCRVLRLPLEAGGPDLENMERVLASQRPKVVYVNPDFQNPTGITYCEGTREQVALLADRHGTYIIEDDFASDLYYRAPPPRSICALDRADRIIYMKSVSALSLPGLRLAMLVVPPALGSRITRAKYLADITSGGLVQRAFDLFVREGGWSRHVDGVRRKLQQRYQLALQALSRHLPQVRCRRPEGGLSLWLELPGGLDGDQVERLARERGLLLLSGSRFGGDASHVRISFAVPGEDELSAGIYLLSRLLGGAARSEERRERRPVV